jgi:hypothetical protein
MPNPGTEMQTSRYIIRAADDGAALIEFIAGIRADPKIKLVDTIGPPEQTHTAVVETDQVTADQLAQRFRNSNQLMIEPDRPLSLFQ